MSVPQRCRPSMRFDRFRSHSAHIVLYVLSTLITRGQDVDAVPPVHIGHHRVHHQLTQSRAQTRRPLAISNDKGRPYTAGGRR